MKTSHKALTIITTIALGGGILGVAGQAGALEYQSNNIPVSFTYTPVLEVGVGSNTMALSVNPGVAGVTANNPITVNTNNALGYTLTARVGCSSGEGCFNTNALKLSSSDNTNMFTMVSANGALSAGDWGISTDSAATGSSSSFKSIAAYSSAATTINKTSDADGTAATGYAGGFTTPFLIGAYPDSGQVAGDYKNVITLEVVANVAP